MVKFDKMSPASYLNDINMKAKEISATFDVNDKVRLLDCKQDFLSVKDHKDDIFRKPSFRLSNPTKTELCIMNHKILTNTC